MAKEVAKTAKDIEKQDAKKAAVPGKGAPAAAPAKGAPVAPVKGAPVRKGAPGLKGAPPVEAEAPKEEKKKKEKKSQKERPKSKKKHTTVQVWKLYKVDGGKAVRKNENCPRCGPGTFLAKFKNRKYCGRCHWGLIQQEAIKG